MTRCVGSDFHERKSENSTLCRHKRFGLLWQATKISGYYNDLYVFSGLLKMQFFGDMSDQSFWNNFYTSRQGNKHFDWFVHFEDVSGYLVPYLPSLGNNCPIPRIIDIGCGTSDFSLKLFDHLKRKCHIDLVDFSPEAIKIMQKILLEQGLLKKSVNPEDFPGIACHRADAKNLPFKEHTFSLALDKGTSDAVLKEKQPLWMWFKNHCVC